MFPLLEPVTFSLPPVLLFCPSTRRLPFVMGGPPLSVLPPPTFPRSLPPLSSSHTTLLTSHSVARSGRMDLRCLYAFAPGTHRRCALPLALLGLRF